MKTIEEMIEVMQAYKEGKTIEACEIMISYKEGKTIEVTNYNANCWKKIDNPAWDWYLFDYRVKPGPKYVPYDSVSEIDRGKWVRNKDYQHILRTISMINTNKDRIYIEGYQWYTLKEFFEIYEYEDGAPCGKVVEQ